MSLNPRITAARAEMAKEGIDSLLLTDPEDIYYYSGVSIDDQAYMIIPISSKPRLVVPTLNNDVSGSVFRVVFAKDFKTVLSSLGHPRRLGIEADSLKTSDFILLKKARLRMKDTSLQKIPRAHKDESEIALIRKAIRTTEQAFKTMNLEGTEKDIGKHMDGFFRKNDCSNAYDTIVASGSRGYFIHTRPSERRIRPKDLVVIDAGARYRGYCADITRTLCRRPGRKERELYSRVLHIQQEIIASLVPGMSLKEIYTLYVKLMKREGFRIAHSFGHGIGLKVHEPLGKTLEKGNVLTVEPGIYIKNYGGIRIEDMVLIDKNKVKLLTSLDRELTFL